MIKPLLKTMIGICTVFLVSNLFADFPNNSFACHVSTLSGKDGIVLIQSDTLKEAVEIAKISKATTIDKKHSTATKVIECKSAYDGKFSSKEMQRFYEKMPR